MRAADVKETVGSLDLDIIRFACGYAEGLRQLIDAQGGRQLAFVLGTRKGDPNWKNQVFLTCMNRIHT